MREIKFRGKRVDNGDWIYGDLQTNSIGDTWISQLDSGDGVNGYFKNVKFNTVGQCTGLKDKNGKDIYEGDVVFYYQPYAKRWDSRKVVYDREYACFGTAYFDQDGFDECDWVKIQEVEVIGNIYDNPEFLKK